MSETPQLIISISGIRGIVDQSLTDEVVRRFAAAFGSWLRSDKAGVRARVILARDTRPSGARFAPVATEALLKTGCDVLDLGPCTTPTAKLMVLERQAEGALILTASHNPGQWNGLKLIRSDGIFLNAKEGQQVEEIYRSNAFLDAPVGGLEKVDPSIPLQCHLQRLLAHVDVDAIRSAALTAAVDLCNGAGALLIPQLLAELGVTADCLNAEPNGLFAHEPEPIPANLSQLRSTMQDGDTSVGFAIDPDGDRVALLDETGRPVGEDYTLAVAVQARTAQQRGTVVTTLSTSQTVSDAAAANDCPVILTPVGEVHVVEAMLEQNALIGGEGNGGVILTQVDPGRDAALGVALTLEAMARERKTLSQLVASLPAYTIEKRKVSCAPEALAKVVSLLCQKYAGAHLHPVQDGAKIYLSGKLECPWIHLRASNTEPVVRILAESARVEEAASLCDEAEALIRAEYSGG